MSEHLFGIAWCECFGPVEESTFLWQFAIDDVVVLIGQTFQ